MTVRIEQRGDEVFVWVKAVPGASRDAIAGELGDRLKVRISAAAEDGKANKAICALLAKALGVKKHQVRVESGRSNPEKVIAIGGVGVDVVAAIAHGDGR